MDVKKNILAICGSTRSSSSNLHLIKAIEELTTDIFNITLFNDLSSIPHFNPDIDNIKPPLEVEAFRKFIRDSDGVLICTPEYAMGVPGSLKNAIDWTVSSCEFSHKPVALITASSLGEKGHASLSETLKIIEAKLTDQTQLVISHVKTKVNAQNKITNEQTLSDVLSVLTGLNNLIGNKKNSY
jgi:chromate reductase